MKNKLSTPVIINLTLIILLIGVGGFYLYTATQTNKPTSINTLATPLPTPEKTKNVYPPVTSIVFPIADTNAETAVFDGRNGQHNGVDFIVPAGTEVKATAAGTVRTVGVLAPFWYRIVIDHNIDNQLITTMYGNLDPDTITVKAGDTVQAGQTIAKTENLAPDTPHLHYEVRLLGANIKPLEWLQENQF